MATDELPGAVGNGLAACPESADARITLMGLLIESTAKLTRLLGAELEASCGLPLTWFDVLIRLGRSPGRRLTMTQLAGEISLTSGGVTRLIDRVAEAGYVERQSCPTDRRTVYVALTPAGQAMLDRATAEHLGGLERHLVAPLDNRERAALTATLTKLRDAASAAGPCAGR
ncbi:MAG: MarR family winged helix-turn-helix transcriptional regulator [Acidimicrobiales bacterium]